MAYIPKDRFIQISAAPFRSDDANISEVFALDESGAVWCYNWEHSIWWQLSRDRAQSETVPAELTRKG